MGLNPAMGMALPGATSAGLVRLGNCEATIYGRVHLCHSSPANHYASACTESERGEAFVPDFSTVMRLIQLDIQIMQFQHPATVLLWIIPAPSPA